MPQSAQRKFVPTRETRRDNTASALPLRCRHGYSTVAPTKRKRDRSESDDDFTSTDSEESTDLEDALESDWDSDSSEETTPSQPQLSSDLKNLTHQLADRTLPALTQWISSARYIPPPTHRIPPQKRSKTSRPTILMETQDPTSPSTILILPIDGYLPLACPFSISNPSLHKSCTLQHPLHSIPDLLKHLKTHHPNPFYCPICGQTFDNEPTCDSHIRVRSCTRKEFDIVRGVSPSQLRMIIERDNRHQPEEDRWRRIYKVLFPGAERPRPGEAYLRQGLPLAVAMARDYWEGNGARLVGEYLAEVGRLNSGGDEKIQIAGEEGVSALCKVVGRELVHRVVAGYGRTGGQTGVDGNAAGLDEDRWENAKAEPQD
ncbi:hypothetical protein B0T21DRAFT_371478 [Apiosordaria backusii]|uniref:C2H2-type domain-containing protein n=1 Tax=Apiosordaria backusii TaxID=314023 RepID=A0AA40B2H3_9PEZI|nr:hypothetical protein B0T21DRAFT_371478 [Apiosordaria backusii]